MKHTFSAQHKAALLTPVFAAVLSALSLPNTAAATEQSLSNAITQQSDLTTLPSGDLTLTGTGAKSLINLTSGTITFTGTAQTSLTLKSTGSDAVFADSGTTLTFTGYKNLALTNTNTGIFPDIANIWGTLTVKETENFSATGLWGSNTSVISVAVTDKADFGRIELNHVTSASVSAKAITGGMVLVRDNVAGYDTNTNTNVVSLTATESITINSQGQATTAVGTEGSLGALYQTTITLSAKAISITGATNAVSLATTTKQGSTVNIQGTESVVLSGKVLATSANSAVNINTLDSSASAKTTITGDIEATGGSVTAALGGAESSVTGDIKTGTGGTTDISFNGADSVMTGNVITTDGVASVVLGGKGAKLDGNVSTSGGKAGITLSGENTLLDGDVTTTGGEASVTLSGKGSAIAGKITTSGGTSKVTASGEGASVSGDVETSAGELSLTLGGSKSFLTGNIKTTGGTAGLSLTGDNSYITGDITTSNDGTTTVDLTGTGAKLTGDVTTTGGTANVSLTGSGSSVTGDVTTTGTGIANLNLGVSGATLTGKITDSNLSGTGGTALTLSEGASWIPTGTSVVTKVTGNGGIVDLSQTSTDDTVKIGTLTGTGTAIKVTDPATSGKVSISKNEGTSLTVTAPGEVNDAYDDAEALAKKLGTLVDVDEGSGYVIHVDEGKVMGAITATKDAGASEVSDISYTVSRNTVLSAIGESVVAQALAFRAQANDVSRRMGDLRTDENNAGAWVRYFGGKNKYVGKSIQNRYNTIQVGGDMFFPVSEGRLYAGLTASYNDGESDLANGSADDKSYGGGVYAGYLADNGWYVDVIAKRLRMTNDFSLTYTTGETARGSYGTYGNSISLETGWRITDPETLVYAEPQFEISVGRIKGYRFTTSSGVAASQGATRSLVGRLGVSIGKAFEDKKGSVYFNVSILNEFKGESGASYVYNGTASSDTSVDMKGAWAEGSVGGTYRFHRNAAVYGEVTASTGSVVKNPVQWTVGARFSF